MYLGFHIFIKGETSTHPYTTFRTRPDEEDKSGKGTFAADRTNTARQFLVEIVSQCWSNVACQILRRQDVERGALDARKNDFFHRAPKAQALLYGPPMWHNGGFWPDYFSEKHVPWVPYLY